MNESRSTPPEAPLREAEPPPAWGYRDLAMLTGFALPSLIAGMGAVNVAFRLLGWRDLPRAVQLVPAELLGYAVFFWAVRAYFRHQLGLALRPALRWVAGGFSPSRVMLDGVLLAVAVVLLGAVLRTPDLEMPMKELLADRLSFALVFVAGVSFGPLFEEWIFRGLLQPVFARSWGAPAGIFLAAACFGVPHLPQYGMSWRHGVLITLAGAAFGACRHVYRSTLASTLMHIAYNLTLFAGYLAHGKGIGN